MPGAVARCVEQRADDGGFRLEGDHRCEDHDLVPRRDAPQTWQVFEAAGHRRDARGLQT
jgi:hypothetical protein